MMRNDAVVRAFSRGQRGAAGALHTDGRSLWSYDLKIAERTLGGIVVADFTSPGGHFVSMTTSKHVGLAKRVADTVMLPELFESIFVKLPF
jgi:hypothetical protein